LGRLLLAVSLYSHPPGFKPRVNVVEIFVAYPYKYDRSGWGEVGYRELLRRLETEYAVKFRYADDSASAAHLSDKVKERIMRCTISAFDLSEWNANVAFEFGIFMGLRLPLARAWLFLNTVQTPDMPSDVRGFAHHRYANPEELEGVWRKALSKYPRRAEIIPIEPRG